jgi:hypothetical protein
MSLEEILKPKYTNALFHKYSRKSTQPYNFLVEHSMKQLKWELNDNYVQKRLEALNLLPINKNQRTTIKRQITIYHKKGMRKIKEFEEKYGEIDITKNPNLYSHFEESWIHNEDTIPTRYS